MYPVAITMALISVNVMAAQLDIPGPPGSVAFGSSIHVLPNGNFIVTDPNFQSSRGAVHLYAGDGTRISTVSGAVAGDLFGRNVHVLPSGNVLVCNPTTSDHQTRNVGSVTLINGTTGLEGSVSEENSLLGSHSNDAVGNSCTVLRNGNYVSTTPSWDSSRANSTAKCNAVEGSLEFSLRRAVA